jgi:hypothetical protein
LRLCEREVQGAICKLNYARSPLNGIRCKQHRIDLPRLVG